MGGKPRTKPIQPPSVQLLEDIKAQGTMGFNVAELTNLHAYLVMVMAERGDTAAECSPKEALDVLARLSQKMGLYDD